MNKQLWKPGTMLYPLPVVMVSCGDINGDKNIITIAWTGTVNSDPAMTYVSIRPNRHSYDMIKESGEFIINITTEDLVYATDFCGVRSGRDIDKFKEMKLTPEKAFNVKCPAIKESPVNIECKVTEIKDLGTHSMFLANVVGVMADGKYMDESGKFRFEDCNPICYSHGEYFSLGNYLGKFGYSVAKTDEKRKRT